MIWFIAFTGTWNACVNTVLSELPSNALQETTIALTQMVTQVVGFIVVFVSPYIQNPTDGNLGAKIGYICENKTLDAGFSSLIHCSLTVLQMERCLSVLQSSCSSSFRN
jgi:hypothetical protein